MTETPYFGELSDRNRDPDRFSVCTTGKYIWLWRWRTPCGSVYYDTRDLPDSAPLVERLRVHPGTGEQKWVECLTD